MKCRSLQHDMAERPDLVITEGSPAALSRRIDELLKLRIAHQGFDDTSHEPGRKQAEAELTKINSEDLPALRGHVWNVRSRTPLIERATRQELFKLAKRIDAALNGIERQRTADLSKIKEHESRVGLATAKTNRGRAHAAKRLLQQKRDGDLAEKHRKATTPEHELARRKKQIYKAKKVQRVYNKLCKTAQISACMRSGADLDKPHI
jgi:hypothetical protein